MEIVTTAIRLQRFFATVAKRSWKATTSSRVSWDTVDGRLLQGVVEQDVPPPDPADDRLTSDVH
jgi:hypothetical protein